MKAKQFLKSNAIWLVFIVEVIIFAVASGGTFVTGKNFLGRKKDVTILSNLLARSDEWLSWTGTIGTRRQAGSLYTSLEWLKTMQQALATAFQYERKTLAEKYYSKYVRIKNKKINS